MSSVVVAIQPPVRAGCCLLAGGAFQHLYREIFGRSEVFRLHALFERGGGLGGGAAQCVIGS